MSAREMLAAAVLVWLIGALVGWCVGWAARGEQNRAWHNTLRHHLTHARTDLAHALEELEDTRAQWEAERFPAPGPAVVHVHLTAPPSWAPPPVLDPTRVIDAVAVLPEGRVSS
jgi:hypothetical protein